MTSGDLVEDLCDDGFEESEDVAAVRQQRDRETGLGNDAEEGGLADGAAVVADDHGAVGRDDLPAEAPCGAHAGEPREHHLGGAHRTRRQRRQDARAVGARALGQMHRDEAEEVAWTHREHRSGGFVRSCECPGRRGDLDAVLAGADVPDGGAEQDRLIGAGRHVGESERRDDVVDERLLPGLVAEHLDESSEQAESDVVVGEELAGSEELRKARDDLDVLLDRVVSPSGVGEHVALEACLVAQQLSCRDGCGSRLILQAELGQIPADRRVQVEEPLVHELQDECGSPHLGDRADLEHGVGVTSTRVDVLSTPAAASMISPSFRTATAAPGTLCSATSSAKRAEMN